MALQKANSVDALNRSRSVPFGTRLFGLGGGGGRDSPVGDPTSTTVPPRAKIPSWYRNLHHSLLSMDGDSDDDDQQSGNNDDDEDFEKSLMKSRRVASVDVDLNSACDSPRTQYQRHSAATEAPRTMKRAESVDVVSSIRDVTGSRFAITNNTPVVTSSANFSSPWRQLQTDLQTHNHSTIIEKPRESESGETSITNVDSLKPSDDNSIPLQANSIHSNGADNGERVVLIATNGVNKQPSLSKLAPPLPKNAPPDNHSTSFARRRHRDVNVSNANDNNKEINKSINADQAECFHDNQQESHLRNEDEVQMKSSSEVMTSRRNEDEDATTVQTKSSAEVMTSSTNLTECPVEIDRPINSNFEAELNGNSACLVTSSQKIDQSNHSLIVRRRLPASPSPVSMATPSNNISLKATLVGPLPTNDRVSMDTGNDKSDHSSHVMCHGVDVLTRTKTSDNGNDTRSRTHYDEQQSGGRLVAMTTTATVNGVRGDRAIVTQPKKQFKWTVAETKSLGRPLSLSQTSRSVTTKQSLSSGTPRRDVVMSGSNVVATAQSMPPPPSREPFNADDHNDCSKQRSLNTEANSPLTDKVDRPVHSVDTHLRESRTTVTPNIQSLLAKFKSVEALPNADQQSWSVAPSGGLSWRPHGKMLVNGTTKNDQFVRGTPVSVSKSKFWSMDNVAAPMKISIPRDTVWSRGVSVVDQGADKETTYNQVSPGQLADNEHHLNESTKKSQTLIPPFAQIQLHKFRSLEDIAQCPPTPTAPNTITTTKTKTTTSPSNCNRRLLPEVKDVERQKQDHYLLSQKTRDAATVNGNSSKDSLLSESTITSPSSSSSLVIGRSSESLNTVNRSSTTRYRQWSPIVRMASSDWSPFSDATSTRDRDQKAARDDATLKYMSAILPPPQRRPASAMSVVSPRTVQTAGRPESSVTLAITKSNAENTGRGGNGVNYRRLPNTPSSNCSRVDDSTSISSNVEVPLEHVSTRQSSLKTSKEQEDTLTTQFRSTPTKEVSEASHTSIPGITTNPRVDLLTEKVDLRSVSPTSTVKLPETPTTGRELEVKSHSVLDVSTCSTTCLDSETVDQTMSTPSSSSSSTPSPVHFKVMSSLFVTLQPSVPFKMTSQCSTHETHSRIRIISSRRVN